MQESFAFGLGGSPKKCPLVRVGGPQTHAVKPSSAVIRDSGQQLTQLNSVTMCSDEIVESTPG